MENQQPDMEISEELGVNIDSLKTATTDKAIKFEDEWKEKELKNKYNKTLIRLLIRDPGWIYCYWEIVEEEFYQNQPVLRLFIENENRYIDINIAHQADDWYISSVKPLYTYKVAIGYRKYDIFQPLAFSRSITTPADRPSANLDQQWLYIEELSKYSYRIDINSTLSLIKSIERRRKKEEKNISSLNLLEGELRQED